MRSQISDPVCCAKVTPGYAFGCKRILPSNRWYRALSQPNVELLTGGLERVTAHTVVTGDGEEREVDAIIFGTGFHATDAPVGRLVRGPAGKTLDEVWQGSPRAHLGATVPGFPNLFVLCGPNTGLGHSSMVYMIESQLAYVMEALRHMTATAPPRSRCARTRRSASTPSSTRAWHARSGTPAARAGTSTRPATTPRCGRIGPGASGSAPRSFDPADFEFARRRR